jgi:hypothetical protein
MTQETQPVHIREILPDIVSHLKHTSQVKPSPAIKGEAQVSVAGVSPDSLDRESELTVLFGYFRQFLSWSFLARSISSFTCRICTGGTVSL